MNFPAKFLLPYSFQEFVMSESVYLAFIEIDMHKINFIIYVNNDLDMYIIYVYIIQKKTYYKNNKKPTIRYFYAKHNYFIP